MVAEHCIHYWRFEMPQGEFSDGVCLKCGDTTVGRNWEPDIAGMFKKDNGGKNKIKPTLAPRDVTWVEGKKGIL